MWALLWRMRREQLRYLLTIFIPFTLTVTVVVVLPMLSDDSTMNGADSSAEFGLRYGASTDSIAAGLLLMLMPGLVALYSTAAAAMAVRNVVGAEAGQGALESLLAAPYTPGGIAGGLLGFAIVITTGQWAVMSCLGVIAVGASVLVHHDSLTLDAGYWALALGLPLMSAWAGASLALLVNLLFPRLSQPGRSGLAGSGGGLGNIVAMLPGFGALLALALGSVDLGAVRLLLIAGGATALIAVASLVGVARGFRPESVLGS